MKQKFRANHECSYNCREITAAEDGVFAISNKLVSVYVIASMKYTHDDDYPNK